MRVPGVRFVQGRNSYRDGDARKYGIAIHNTSNNATDAEEASYARRRPDGTSSHFYVDGDSIVQSIDTHERAGHAGSTHGNDHGIAVEITGGNGKSRQWWLTHVAWDKLGAVLAAVIRHHWPDGSFQVRRASVAEMRRNPRVKALYGHNDMRLAWGGTDHTDPGPNFPWDRLLQAINSALGGAEEDDDMALSKEGRAAVRAEVLAALDTARPYYGSAKSGPRSRLKNGKLHPPAGWGDIGLRGAVDYIFERTMAAAREQAGVSAAVTSIAREVVGIGSQIAGLTAVVKAAVTDDTSPRIDVEQFEELMARVDAAAQRAAGESVDRVLAALARNADVLDHLAGEGAELPAANPDEPAVRPVDVVNLPEAEPPGDPGAR